MAFGPMLTSNLEVHSRYSKRLEKIYNVDNGRFRELLDCVKMKDTCFKCIYFNPLAEDSYRCRCIPHCPGATLSSDVKKYLLMKLQ